MYNNCGLAAGGNWTGAFGFVVVSNTCDFSCDDDCGDDAGAKCDAERSVSCNECGFVSFC